VFEKQILLVIVLSVFRFLDSNPFQYLHTFPTVVKHNRKNQYMKIQNTEVQNGEPENDEVITVQPPTYEEAVPVELDLDFEKQILLVIVLSVFRFLDSNPFQYLHTFPTVVQYLSMTIHSPI
jgi:hypothetical protein